MHLMIGQAIRMMANQFRTLTVALVLAAMPMTGATAQIQVPDDTVARSVIMSLYTINAMFEQQGAGLESGKQVMTSYRAFLAPQLIEDISASDGGFRPLAGTHQGSVDDYELRMAADQPEHAIVLEAAVQSQGSVRLISFALDGADGRPIVTGIWGEGWSFGDGRPGATQPENDASAPQPGADKQAALARADESSAEQSSTSSSANTPALPFRDDFDGGTLGTHWTVIGENLETFVVDGGVIYQIATGGDDDFRNEGSENIFRLGAMPDGDFDMTLQGRLEAKTGREGVWLGLYETFESFLAANLFVDTSGCGPYLNLRIVNRQSVTVLDEPLTSEFGDNLFDKGPLLSSYCTAGNREIGDAILERFDETGFSLTLSRRGFRYFATVVLDLPPFGDNPGGPVSISTREVARTTAAGYPAFMLGQFSRAGNGETVAEFDSFSISPAAHR